MPTWSLLGKCQKRCIRVTRLTFVYVSILSSLRNDAHRGRLVCTPLSGCRYSPGAPRQHLPFLFLTTVCNAVENRGSDQGRNFYLLERLLCPNHAQRPTPHRCTFAGWEETGALSKLPLCPVSGCDQPGQAPANLLRLFSQRTSVGSRAAPGLRAARPCRPSTGCCYPPFTTRLFGNQIP